MSIKAAITQSIDTNSIVRLEVEGDLLDATLGVPGWAGEFDYAEENDGSLDVWGTDYDGNDWRVKLIAA